MDVAPHRLGVISLGGDWTARMQTVLISEWSDDDDTTVAPHMSTKVPSHNTRM